MCGLESFLHTKIDSLNDCYVKEKRKIVPLTVLTINIKYVAFFKVRNFSLGGLNNCKLKNVFKLDINIY